MPRLPRPSPAMVVATAALVAAMGGAGYAQVQERLDGRDLLNRSVSTPKLQLGSVRAAQLGTGAVTTTKLRTGAVTARKVARGAVGTDQLADGGVRAPDIGPAAVGSAQLAPGAVTEGAIAPGAVTRGRIAPEAQVPLTTVRRSAVVVAAPGTVGTAIAACAPGERLTGGGAGPADTSPTPELHGAGGIPVPNGDGDVPSQWQGFVLNAGVAPQAIVAYAICARAA